MKRSKNEKKKEKKTKRFYDDREPSCHRT